VGTTYGGVDESVRPQDQLVKVLENSGELWSWRTLVLENSGSGELWFWRTLVLENSGSGEL
jgi:hypothetical protein